MMRSAESIKELDLKRKEEVKLEVFLTPKALTKIPQGKSREENLKLGKGQ